MTRVPFLAGTGIFLLVKHPDQLWGPMNLLPNGHQGSFHETNRPGQSMKLIMHFIQYLW
jgi:hypothetical protein